MSGGGKERARTALLTTQVYEIKLNKVRLTQEKMLRLLKVQKKQYARKKENFEGLKVHTKKASRTLPGSLFLINLKYFFTLAV